jgi:hypothetical protein
MEGGMVQRLTVAALLALLFGFAGEADAQCATCEKHTPYARFAERVQLASSGETVRNEVTFRNADSCGCGRTCFTLSYGYHPPHDGSASLRVTRTRLEQPDGRAFGPAVCLAPGEEATAWVALTLGAQDGAGYVTPSVMVKRQGGRMTYPDILVDWFDAEGGAVCVGYDYATCRGYVYEPAGSQ